MKYRRLQPTTKMDTALPQACLNFFDIFRLKKKMTPANQDNVDVLCHCEHLVLKKVVLNVTR